MINLDKTYLRKDVRYLLAMSMGVDSVAAFMYLMDKGYNVYPIHFNHKLRDRNDIMEERYRELCAALQIDPIVGRGCFDDDATEADFREARFRFFGVTVSNILGDWVSNDYPCLITAHHLNDWVESYLMNCLRGHPDHAPFKTVDYRSLYDDDSSYYRVIHPFLASKKSDLVEYAERNFIAGQRGIGWVVNDDSNNGVKRSRRNWIRNILIPLLSGVDINLEKFALRKVISEQEIRKYHHQ